MDSRYIRPASPGSRRLTQPGRSSTGTLVYPSSYDPYFAPPRASRDSIAGPRSSADRIIAPRITSRTVRDDRLPSGRIRDDYAVSPRRATLDPLSSGSRRPLTVVRTSSPDRYRPVISSATEKPSSPLVKTRNPDDGSYYLQPASSSSSHRREHYRNYSADNKDIPRHLSVSGRKDRLERGGYRSSGHGSSRSGYSMNAPLVRPPRDEDDRDYGYEYTDRKEQMYRDTVPRPRPRRESDSGRRERPLSLTGLEDYLPKTGVARGTGPPVTTRGLDKLERGGTTRTEYRIPREPDLAPSDHGNSKVRDDLDGSSRRRSTRASVALHQDPNAERSAYRDDHKDLSREHRHGTRRAGSLDRAAEDHGLGIRGVYDDDSRDSEVRGDVHRRHHESLHSDDREIRRDREHRHEATQQSDRDGYGERDHRTRDEPRKEKHKDHKHSGDLAMGAAGIAAVGLVAEGVKNRQHRDKDATDTDISFHPNGHPLKRESDRSIPAADPVDGNNRSDENSDEDRRERRRRRREREAREHESEAKEADTREEVRHRGQDDEPGHGREHVRKEPDSHDHKDREGRDLRDETEEARRSHRHRRHHHQTSDHASYDEDSSEEDPRDRRQTHVRVVSPAREKTPENKPKGILRQPREKFPEDPAPVREGVAPLKDAGKKGIPPNARWTKIDRKLVNPEALEMGNERYEERIDYVIVLRVLTKEEIEQYAMKTQEIRDERQYEERRRRLKALEDAERNHEREAPKRLEYRPQINSTYSSNEDSKSHQYDSGQDPKRDQRDKSTSPQSVSTLPSIPPDGSLKEDPQRPGIYSGYQRNPPLPTRPEYHQPPMKQEYPPQPSRPDYSPQPPEYPPPPSKEPSPQPLRQDYPNPQFAVLNNPQHPHPDYAQPLPQGYPQYAYPDYSQPQPQPYPQPLYQSYGQPPYQDYVQPLNQNYLPPPPPRPKY